MIAMERLENLETFEGFENWKSCDIPIDVTREKSGKASAFFSLPKDSQK
jgi:hypothetical protein